MNREEIKNQLKRQLSAQAPIIGVSAGSGLTAKCAQKGGADLIFVNHAGYFRMAGRSTLLSKFSFGNANDTMLKMAGEVLPVLHQVPAIAGVFAQDPFRNMDILLENVKKLGFSGVQNSPTLGMMKPAMANNMEAGMLGFFMEIDMIRKAHDMGFFTAPIVHRPEQAEQFVAVHADLIVATVGITVGEEDGVPVPDLDDNIRAVASITSAAKAADPDVFVLAHGGALSTPEAVQKALDAIPQLDGFVGGSAIERIPVEKAIYRIVDGFKHAGQAE